MRALLAALLCLGLAGCFSLKPAPRPPVCPPNCPPNCPAVPPPRPVRPVPDDTGDLLPPKPIVEPTEPVEVRIMGVVRSITGASGRELVEVQTEAGSTYRVLVKRGVVPKVTRTTVRGHLDPGDLVWVQGKVQPGDKTLIEAQEVLVFDGNPS